jgi:predicted dehydrogenase
LFVDAIAQNQAIECDFSVGLRVQSVVDAALRSSDQKQWITVGAA